MDKNHNNTRLIAKNTLMLYFRQILIMLVSLYTVRVVLNVLGAEDYGIYNVVAGVVTMFSFLSGSMATASQRFFSVYIGKNDPGNLKKYFCVTLTTYLFIALILIIISETLGLWFVNNKLVIPTERKTAALWIYQFSIIGFLFTVMVTPFMSSIIAHENMNVYAYVSIIEVGLRLAVVYLLKLFLIDKLFLYGLLLLGVAVINSSLYFVYSVVHYEECRLKFLWNKKIFVEISSYTGWNLMGAISSIFRNQGINILLNMFFGPIINAARGVAFQVSNALNSFAQNFSTAFRPQIVKTYAADEKEKCMNLVFMASKISFFLMFFISLPVLLQTPFLLKVWLKQVPDYTILFTRLVVIDAVIESISFALIGLMSAHGRIKEYQLIVSGITLLNLPVSFIFLKLGFPAQITMIIAIVISIVAFVARLWVLRWLTSLNLSSYFKNVLLPILVVTVISSIIPLIVNHLMNENFISFICVGFVSVISVGFGIWFLGLSKTERKSVVKKIQIKLKGNRK